MAAVGVAGNATAGASWRRARSSLRGVRLMSGLLGSTAADSDARRRGYLAFVPAMLVRHLEERRLAAENSLGTGSGSQITPHIHRQLGVSLSHYFRLFFFSFLSFFAQTANVDLRK